MKNIFSLSSIFRSDSPYKQFILSLLLTGLGYGIYKGVMDNYLAEIVGMQGFDRGVTEFFREIPGLLLVFILAALYTLSAERLFKLGAVIMMGGMVALSFVPATKVLVIFSLFIFSLGEHIQLGMKNTLSLEYAQDGKGGQALGQQNAIYQIGNLVGFVVIIASFTFLLTQDRIEFLGGKEKVFRIFFIVSSILFAIAMFVSFTLHTTSGQNQNKNRFYFRKKFFKYYMLEVFYGARKQVFFTFGPYVLILFYGANAMHISLLFAISAILCFFLAPLVGKIIDKIGYKTVMISDTLILVIVCFFYGFAHHIFPKNIAFIICCVNYILDSIISLASMASNVYVQDISESKDETQKTISTGVSVNHLITILIALFGGLIWQKVGIETLFVISAILGLCNSAYAATIKTKFKKNSNE